MPALIRSSFLKNLIDFIRRGLLLRNKGDIDDGPSDNWDADRDAVEESVKFGEGLGHGDRGTGGRRDNILCRRSPFAEALARRTIDEGLRPRVAVSSAQNCLVDAERF